MTRAVEARKSGVTSGTKTASGKRITPPRYEPTSATPRPRVWSGLRGNAATMNIITKTTL
jgi:hypothetical protein